MQLSINGSKIHSVTDVHVERLDSGCVATGYVSGRQITVTYHSADLFCDIDGESRGAKPWLRQVRRDLLQKYLDIYGDVPGVMGRRRKTAEHSLLMVDEAFIQRLVNLGFTVTEMTVIFSPIHKVEIGGLSQLEAIKRISAMKADYLGDLARETEQVEAALKALVA